MTDPVTAASVLPATTPRPKSQSASDAGRAFEQMFLAEMLSHTGLGQTSAFGGGIGEEQFRSFLVQEQARMLAESGGIGLAAVINANLTVSE
jgi:peptidoglycan hydrolase FlgJ